MNQNLPFQFVKVDKKVKSSKRIKIFEENDYAMSLKTNSSAMFICRGAVLYKIK